MDSKAAETAYVNEVAKRVANGSLSPSAGRVATGLAPFFFWDRMNENGAPLYLNHAEVLKHVDFSRGLLFGSRAELINAGLITVVGKSWHAGGFNV